MSCSLPFSMRHNTFQYVYPHNNNNNVYLKSNIQTSSMDCTYQLIKYKNEYHVNVQEK